jgi:hypothetical protein
MEEPTTTENFDYLFINGQSNFIRVNNPIYDGIILKDFESIEPLVFKNQKDEIVKPTIDQVQNEKRKYYVEFFKKPFKNLLVLTGAGSSMGVGGKSMNELWDKAERSYYIDEKEDEETKEKVIIDSDFKALCTKLNFNYTTKNLESLLSKIEGVIKFQEDLEVELHDSSKKRISEFRTEIFELIVNECTIPTPSPDDFPHKIFLDKILQRKLTNPRVKLFTLNYDTLFEDAARLSNAILIDGFSYTFPRTFSGRFFDYDIVQREGSKLKEEDNFVQRVLHLHKLHGSINWTRKRDTNEVVMEQEPEIPLMVYPRESKYEDSYEQPFFEMMARFQRNLRQSNDTLLICIGYSFNDKHINSAIEEALNQNPGFRLAVVDPGINSENASMTEIRKNALKTNRIMMVSETFSDFASNYPEIQTYNDVQMDNINLVK